MPSIAIIVFVLLTVSSRAPAGFDRPSAGPPLVCHQFDIGGARSLHWTSGPFGMDPQHPVAGVPAETVDVLKDSQDAVVHMETLRRAYLYLKSGPPDEALVALGGLLKDRILDAEISLIENDYRGFRPEQLRWFDLGYLMAIIENNGGPALAGRSSSERVLEYVAEFAPRRADIQFGVGFALMGNRHESGKGPLLLAAVLTSDEDSVVARNLIGTNAHLWPAESRPGWRTMREILLGRREPGAETRRDEGVVWCPLGRARDPVPVLKVGTVTQACGDMVLMELHRPPPTDTRPQDVFVGDYLDLISADHQTYVGQIRIIGRSAGVAAGIVRVKKQDRDMKAGDLVVAGLN